MAAYSTYTDQELTDLLKIGNNSAFTEIYERYWDRLLHFAHQKTDNFMDAENVVQDVFVSLWNRRDTLQVNSTLARYLTVSVKYRVIKLFNKQHSQTLFGSNDAGFDILDDSTQEYLDFEELRYHLEKILTTLPRKSVLIYRMSQEQDMSHKEIAAEMGMSEKAINSQLVRTKKVLRTGLNNFLLLFLL